MKEEDKAKVIQLFKEGSTSKARSRRATPKPSIQIKGDNAQISGRDIINNTTINHINPEKPAPKPKIQVKTGDGVINASQKARIQHLVKTWIDTYNAVHVEKKTWPAAWGAVKIQADVNTYHEIKLEDFEEIEKWLLKQIAIKNAMPSAKKKSPAWRNGRIRGIQSRCNELGIQDKRKEYMKKTFGQDSLTMLSDDDVDKVYRWVMSKK